MDFHTGEGGTNPVGLQLRRLREAAGLSLTEAAGRAALGLSTLSQWESGRKNPSGAALDVLLSVLGTAPRIRAGLLVRVDPAHARVVLADDPLGPPVDIGQILRGMRIRAGINQGELAKRAGLTQSAISKWENGDSVPNDSALHTALSALEATTQETQYVLSARFSPHAEEGRTVWERLDTHQELPGPLREVGLMAMEREFWAATARDPQATNALIAAMARRANTYRLQLRLDEAEALGRRVLRMAEATGSWDEAHHAYMAVVFSRMERTGDIERAAAAGLRVTPRLRQPHVCALHLVATAPLANWVGATVPPELVQAGIERVATEAPDPRGVLTFGATEGEMRVGWARVQLYGNDPEGCIETLSQLSDVFSDSVDQAVAGVVRLRALLRIGERPTEAMERAAMPVLRTQWSAYVREREIFDRSRGTPVFDFHPFGDTWQRFRTGPSDNRSKIDSYVTFLV